MVTITLPDELAERIEAIAQRENRPISEVVQSMIEHYEPQTHLQEEADAAFESIFGIYDDDITDMSTTVRETIQKYFKDKYGNAD
jgi:metal-responsive CopG/Arc/MetJ family transcriptional regulator